MVNNADWLMKLEYIPFIRDIGVHFSVNRMLSADCFKTRMQSEAGLSFLEFNYMLMQAYDFYKLNELYDCKLEFGGDDQWSNIIAGTDLIRRKTAKSAYGMTFQLLTRSDGVKMGKTMSGAVWLDPEKTSPYDFYQYWRNIEDASVEKCLALLTFLPMEEVRRLGALQDAEINKAKEVLAFEVTKIVHSEEEAIKAQEAARQLFGKGGTSADAPTTELTKEELEQGIGILDLLKQVGLSPSNSEGRRLVMQGSVAVNDEIIIDKFKCSAFLNTNLSEELQKRGTENIIMAGMRTELCVDTTCRVAFEYGYNVIIPKGCTSTFDTPLSKGEDMAKYFEDSVFNSRFSEVAPLENILNRIRA